MPEQMDVQRASDDVCGTPHDDGSGPSCRGLADVAGCGPVDPVRYRGVRRANTRPPGGPRSPAPVTPA